MWSENSRPYIRTLEGECSIISPFEASIHLMWRQFHEAGEVEGADLDELYHTLAHQRRRFVLFCLSMHDKSCTLADIASEVASQEQDIPITDIPSEEVERVHLSLYHVHVPKLAEANLVEYDRETGMIEATPRFEPLKQHVGQLIAG